MGSFETYAATAGTFAAMAVLTVCCWHPPQVKFAGDRCCVCDSDVDYDFDQLVSCDSCGITVHQSCYGVSELPGVRCYQTVCQFWLVRVCWSSARRSLQHLLTPVHACLKLADM